VRVPSAHAGRRGRCPNCKQVIEIPDEGSDIPPPPSVRDAEPEELDLSPDTQAGESASGETDILPAITEPAGRRRKSGPGAPIRAGKRPETRPGASAPRSRGINPKLLAALVALSAGAIALIVWMLVR
jgi:hypothetical protein